MKHILTISILALSITAHANIDNSDCPTGRKGQAEATKANFMSVLAKGTYWQNPAKAGLQVIKFVKNGVFKLDYRGSYPGQFPRTKRKIVLDQPLKNSKLKGFNGAMIVGGRLVVEMDAIYFTIKNGRCTLITKTNPNEYHSSTKNYPYKDPKHHLLDDGNGNLLTKNGEAILVLRQYTWSRL